MTPSLHHAEDIPGEDRDLIDAERGIYDVDFWVIKDTRMPAVLFEAGVIKHREEEADLDLAPYRARLVECVVRATRAFAREPVPRAR